MDVSRITDDLFVASSFYPLDRPPGSIILDVTTFPDAELDAYSENAMAAMVTTTQVLRSQGYAVILRCQAGRNRSAAVAAICLVQDGLTAEEAIAAVRQARGHLNGGALTNESFVRYISGLALSRTAP